MREETQDLLDRAYDMDDSPAKVAVLEEALRELDAGGDMETAYDTRMDIVEAATFCGLYDNALVAFTWCLAAYDRDPETYDVHDLLWRYKWIAGQLPGFVEVSRAQIAQMQDDMQRRYEQLGFGLRPVEMQRCENAMIMGDVAEAQRAHGRWRELPRDELADCTACEADQHMDYLIFASQDEQAITEFEKLIDSGLGGTSVPQRSYGKILRSYMTLHREEDADRICETGYRLSSTNRMFLWQLSEFLLYHVRQRDFAAAQRLLEKHVSWALTTADAQVRLQFYRAAACMFELLANQGPTCKLRLPSEFPQYQSAGIYQTGDLYDWFTQQADEITAKFNERNGNPYYTQLMQESRAFAKL